MTKLNRGTRAMYSHKGDIGDGRHMMVKLKVDERRFDSKRRHKWVQDLLDEDEAASRNAEEALLADSMEEEFYYSRLADQLPVLECDEDHEEEYAQEGQEQ